MTRNTTARTAGFAFLFYIAAGLSSLGVAREAPLAAVISMLTSFSALVLGVTLYAITRDQDPVLAMLGMVCRVIEGVPDMSGEIYFAAGSLLFSWLLFRGQMIPAALAWLGVIASAVLVVFIPAQLTGVLGDAVGWGSPVTWAAWLPMLAYEVTLGSWLIVKGAAPPAPKVPKVT